MISETGAWTWHLPYASCTTNPVQYLIKEIWQSLLLLFPYLALKSCCQNVYPHFHILPFLLHYSMASSCFEILRWKNLPLMFHCETSKQSAAVIDLEVIRYWIVDPDISFYSMNPCWLTQVQSCAAWLQLYGLCYEGLERQILFYLCTHVNSKAYTYSMEIKMCIPIYRISKAC